MAKYLFLAVTLLAACGHKKAKTTPDESGDSSMPAAVDTSNTMVPPEIRAALLARQIDSDDVLAGLTVPVLVTHGTRDAVVLPSMAEHVLSTCPSAIPRYSHVRRSAEVARPMVAAVCRRDGSTSARGACRKNRW